MSIARTIFPPYRKAVTIAEKYVDQSVVAMYGAQGYLLASNTRTFINLLVSQESRIKSGKHQPFSYEELLRMNEDWYGQLKKD